MSTEAEIEAGGRAVEKALGCVYSGRDEVAQEVLAAVEPLIRERLAQEVEALPLGEWRTDDDGERVWFSYGPGDLRLAALDAIRGDAS